jgi:hypothetical protein
MVGPVVCLVSGGDRPDELSHPHLDYIDYNSDYLMVRNVEGQTWAMQQMDLSFDEVQASLRAMHKVDFLEYRDYELRVYHDLLRQYGDESIEVLMRHLCVLDGWLPEIRVTGSTFIDFRHSRKELLAPRVEWCIGQLKAMRISEFQKRALEVYHTRRNKAWPRDSGDITRILAAKKN